VVPAEEPVEASHFASLYRIRTSWSILS